MSGSAIDIDRSVKQSFQKLASIGEKLLVLSATESSAIENIVNNAKTTDSCNTQLAVNRRTSLVSLLFFNMPSTFVITGL